MALPNFLVIGAPKAGTTALHSALAAHPQIFMSPVKEPRYFLCSDNPPPRRGGPGDAQTYQEYVWRRTDYEDLFAGSDPGLLRGESSPFYLWDRQAHRRIQAAIPEARLIALLRDPVERAYSNWAHLWSAGLEPCHDFLAGCAEEPARVAAGWAPFWRYLELGKYGEQLRDLLAVFPRSQVLIVRYRELRDAPAPTLDRVCRFLGVQPGVIDQVPHENVRPHISSAASTRVVQQMLRRGAAVGHHFPLPLRRVVRGPLLTMLQRGGRPRDPLTPEQRTALLPHFAADIDLLEALSGIDLTPWRASDGAPEAGLLAAMR